jgi:hypothetical protein
MNDEVYPIGTRVVKRSGKPFLSGNLVNTVKGYAEHPYKRPDGLPVRAYTFYEDNSLVECAICYKAK